MHTAHHRHIHPPGPQVGHPAFHRNQRRRTGGVDDVVRPPEIQPVCDAPGHKVRHQRGRHSGVERRQRGLQPGFEFGQYVGRGVGVQLAQDGQKPVDHQPVLHNGGKAPVDVGAAPEDHRHPVAGHRTDGKPGILGRLGRDLKRKKLVRLAPVDRVGHDTMLQGIEHGQVAQKPALVGIDPVI